MNMRSEYDRDKYVYGRADRHVRSFNLQRLGREIQGGIHMRVLEFLVSFQEYPL